jgi:hypothetical protein
MFLFSMKELERINKNIIWSLTSLRKGGQKTHQHTSWGVFARGKISGASI